MFQYDHAGNLLADDKARYSYDAFNRTERVETFDGNIQLNRYDAEGLRYEMEENGNLVRFIFNQNREAVSEEDNSGLNRLIRGTELIASRSSADSARTYYHYASDEMGSTTHIVDEAGAVQNRYEYDAWGNITTQEEAVPNRFKFTGQQFDPVTQQYYLRARFYNPVIARFTQEDTYRGDGLNLYAYCANNPVFYRDPSGNMSQCMKDAYLEARRAGATKEEAYAAAKAAYEQNHVDSDPRPTVDVPDDRSMTREQWNDAYRDARMGTQTVDGVKIYSDATLIKASEAIHSAQYGDKWRGKVNTISVTQAADGTVAVTKNNSVIGSVSQSVAKEFFGDSVVIPSGKGVQYDNSPYGSPQNRDQFTTNHPKHAEARGIQGLLNLGVDPTGARQATTRPACPSCEQLQRDWGMTNLTS